MPTTTKIAPAWYGYFLVAAAVLALMAAAFFKPADLRKTELSKLPRDEVCALPPEQVPDRAVFDCIAEDIRTGR
jgi:hypothetical protein